MKRLFHNSIALVVALALMPWNAQASVNEALSIAFEAATPYVEDGLSLIHI